MDFSLHRTANSNSSSSANGTQTLSMSLTKLIVWEIRIKYITVRHTELTGFSWNFTNRVIMLGLDLLGLALLLSLLFFFFSIVCLVAHMHLTELGSWTGLVTTWDTPVASYTFTDNLGFLFLLEGGNLFTETLKMS